MGIASTVAEPILWPSLRGLAPWECQAGSTRMKGMLWNLRRCSVWILAGSGIPGRSRKQNPRCAVCPWCRVLGLQEFPVIREISRPFHAHGSRSAVYLGCSVPAIPRVFHRDRLWPGQGQPVWVERTWNGAGKPPELFCEGLSLETGNAPESIGWECWRSGLDPQM